MSNETIKSCNICSTEVILLFAFEHIVFFVTYSQMQQFVSTPGFTLAISSEDAHAIAIYRSICGGEISTPNF